MLSLCAVAPCLLVKASLQPPLFRALAGPPARLCLREVVDVILWHNRAVCWGSNVAPLPQVMGAPVDMEPLLGVACRKGWPVAPLEALYIRKMNTSSPYLLQFTKTLRHLVLPQLPRVTATALPAVLTCLTALQVRPCASWGAACC